MSSLYEVPSGVMWQGLRLSASSYGRQSLISVGILRTMLTCFLLIDGEFELYIFHMFTMVHVSMFKLIP